MVTNSPTPKSVMSIASAIEGVNNFIGWFKANSAQSTEERSFIWDLYIIMARSNFIFM